MVKPRDYKHDYKLQKARPHEKERRAKRQEARRDFDEKHTGKRTVAASERKNKDLSHKLALSKGGGNGSNVRLESPSANRARNYSKGRPKGAKNRPTKKG